MAYNNGFPMNYGYQPIQQPQVPQMQPQMMQPQVQQQNNNMIWVQGEAGAKSFLLAPNTTLPLWDSENPVIYLKSSDASGMPSMKVLDYTVRENTGNLPTKTPLNGKSEDYVTKEEFVSFKSEVSEMIKKEMGV